MEEQNEQLVNPRKGMNILPYNLISYPCLFKFLGHYFLITGFQFIVS